MAMGRKAELIFKSFAFGEETHKNNYAVLLAKFMGFLYLTVMWFMSEHVSTSMSKNVRSLDSFMRGLYGMSENCDFEDKKWRER